MSNNIWKRAWSDEAVNGRERINYNNKNPQADRQEVLANASLLMLRDGHGAGFLSSCCYICISRRKEILRRQNCVCYLVGIRVTRTSWTWHFITPWTLFWIFFSWHPITVLLIAGVPGDERGGEVIVRKGLGCDTNSHVSRNKRLICLLYCFTVRRSYHAYSGWIPIGLKVRMPARRRMLLLFARRTDASAPSLWR